MGESKLLKVTGIIMIVGGALMMLFSIIGFFGGTFLSVHSEVTGGIYMLISMIALIGAVIELVAGIMGAKNWNKPEKAQACITMGIILIAISVVNNAASMVIAGNFSGVTNLLIGLVLPALYTYGAMQLKKAA